MTDIPSRVAAVYSEIDGHRTARPALAVVAMTDLAPALADAVFHATGTSVRRIC